MTEPPPTKPKPLVSMLSIKAIIFLFAKLEIPFCKYVIFLFFLSFLVPLH